jgi:riboflavin synthase
MFTGIVTGLGRVVALERRRGGARLTVEPPARYGRFAEGESISVSGVCLTAIAGARTFVADLSGETLRRSTLGRLSPGDAVNLEKALVWGDRLSGHFVLGHVDGVSRLVSARGAGNSRIYRFSIPRSLSRFVAEKGSIALDGVSLTVASRRAADFDVAVIPETLRRTTLGVCAEGALFNFEVDVFARYGASGWRRRVARRNS